MMKEIKSLRHHVSQFHSYSHKETQPTDYGKKGPHIFLRTDHTNFASFHHLALDRHAQFDERTHLHIPVTLSAVCQGGIALIRVCTFV